MRAEHDLGGLGRELPAVVGGAGLHHHRLALRRARHRQRSAHLEELAGVIEHVTPVGIVEAALLLVEDEGVVVPGVPQAAHDLDELAGAPVAHRLRQMVLAAEILRLRVIGRGDQIPAGAAAADQVERGEAACDMIGLVVGRGRGADEADVLRHRRERGQQRHRIDPGHIGGARQRLAVVALAGQRIGGEQQVEQPALGRPGGLDIFRKIQSAVGPGILVPPSGDVMRRRAQKHSKLDLARRGHQLARQFDDRLCPFRTPWQVRNHAQNVT